MPSTAEVEPDPLADQPDVAPDPEGTEEGLETDIPASGEPGEDHPVEVPF